MPSDNGNGNGQNGKANPFAFRRNRHAKGRYAPKGDDFPRRGMEITPDEILYDPRRVLGRGVQSTMEPTGETVLNQPRVETTAIRFTESIDDRPPCPQLPVIKRQIHLDLSRDSETFFTCCCADVPAMSSIIVTSFETFNNLRTFVRWLDFKVYDALDPSQIDMQIRVEGAPRKFLAVPNIVCGTGGLVALSATVSSPTAYDFRGLPHFENILMEISDRRHVEVVVNNASIADRKVCVCMWGWIESITVFDETVKR